MMVSAPTRRSWGKALLAWCWWGVFAFGGTTAEIVAGSLQWRHLVDVGLGVLLLVLARWRRARPALIGALAALIAPLTISGAVAAVWIFGSVCSTRDWRKMLPATLITFTYGGVVWAYFAVLSEQMTIEATGNVPTWLFYVAGYWTWVVPYALVLALGSYLGARRDLISSLRERAELAEERRRFEVAGAQAEERNRIAREMHDVVAHRISLVSMQASALTFREDLSRDETRELAGQIQSNARQALDELRSVLGSLRNVDDDGDVAKPQPTLTQLPALLAEAREAGQKIDATVNVDTSSLSASLSRHAFRIVQEGLTNARKHAAGTLVTLVVDERQSGLRIRITNPLRVGEASVPGAGQGLIGLGERVELAGGRFTAGPSQEEFQLEAWMPWPSES